MGFKLRLFLFVALIAVPAGILTVLSLRAALDDRRSVLANLRTRVPALQSAFQDRLRSILERVRQPPAVGSPTYGGSIPEVEFIFDLDEGGHFASPQVLRPRLLERDPAFAAALRLGEELELGLDDLPKAAEAYGKALEVAANDAESVEALNALARCSHAAGDSALTESLHGQLQQFAHALDPDGAHPLTHSYVRRVRRWLPAARLDHTFLDSAAWERGVGTIREWTAAVLDGRIPLHPGTRLAVNAMRDAMRSRWKHDVVELEADLDRIEWRADFVAAYDRLLETSVVQPHVTYLSGLGGGGRSWFAALQPATGTGTVGCTIDLNTLAESILNTPGGSQVRAAGFDIALFDADYTADFERRYTDAVRVVAPVSPTIYRLNVGLYSRDEPFVLEHFRNRNALIIAGIAFLAGSIGLGAYVLARETAREAQMSNLQSEFVANVSHELRTPLTAIRMYAETLLLDRFRSDGQRREYLETVMRESLRLSRMVANILEFSRMESGRKTYDFEDADLAAIVAAALGELEAVFKERDFQLVVDIAPDLPRVHVDPEAIQTAVANVLSNAVKYSLDCREVGVHVRASQTGVILEVVDRGVGIPEGESKSVFQKYKRASNASAAATGTGLGLALVAGILEAHGGSVEALPRAGGGSVLRMRLPING